jgi:integrase/recombinase XerD
MAAVMALTLPAIETLVRALFYYTGLRVSPLCGLRVGDCSFAEVRFEDGTRFPGSVRSIGKGNKEIVIPLHPALKDVLFAWVVEHTDMQPGSWLLRQRTGRPYSRRMVEKMTARWGQRAGVPACVPHRFRHSFATDLLAQGVGIRVIQELLAHADIKSTMLYTKVSDPQMSAAILRLPTWGPRP